MSGAQEKFYWRLWAMLRTAVPGVDRHATHTELGLPGSHTTWGNADFDRWKGHCMAKAQPGNYTAQIEAIRQPAVRKLAFIGHLLAALEEGQAYAEGIVAKMNSRRKFGSGFRTLETLAAGDLEKVMIALKKECRRRWREKDALLGEIHALRLTHDYDEGVACEAVERALNAQPGQLPPLVKMVYEDLLVVLSALRAMGPGAQPALAFAEPETGEVVNADNCPF